MHQKVITEIESILDCWAQPHFLVYDLRHLYYSISMPIPMIAFSMHAQRKSTLHACLDCDIVHAICRRLSANPERLLLTMV